MNRNSPIILAIDSTDIKSIANLIAQTEQAVGVYKFGLEFYLAHGKSGVEEIRSLYPDLRIFLDLKLHDIPNTVRGAAASVYSLKPEFLTVHASGGTDMVRAAADALPETLVTAVTILTSLDSKNLAEMGISTDLTSTTRLLASRSLEGGARALVTSPHEVELLRNLVGDSVTLITPGIRLQAGSDDQKRTMTPVQAIEAGSDYLVIGRPITGADNPAKAASAILASLQ